MFGSLKKVFSKKKGDQAAGEVGNAVPEKMAEKEKKVVEKGEQTPVQRGDGGAALYRMLEAQENGMYMIYCEGIYLKMS